MEANDRQLVEDVIARTIGRNIFSTWFVYCFAGALIILTLAVPRLPISGGSDDKQLVQAFFAFWALFFFVLGIFIVRGTRAVKRARSALLFEPATIVWHYVHNHTVTVAGVPTVETIRVGLGLTDGTDVLLATADQREHFIRLLYRIAPNATEGHSPELARAFKKDPTTPPVAPEPAPPKRDPEAGPPAADPTW